MKNWLDKFQEGGAKSPIYTTDKSKVKAYKDSLNLYNQAVGKLKYWKENPNATNEELNQEEGRLAKLFPYNPFTRPFIGSSDWTYIGTGNARRGVPLYTKPIQPYILGRKQEQVNYLNPNNIQQLPSQYTPSNPEYLYGEEMVPYIDRVNNGQYPGGWEERGMRMEKIKYQKGGVKSPIYTTDKSKVQAYTDSLNIYNSTKGMINDLRRYENTYVGDELGKQWLKYANNWYDKNEKSTAQSFKRLTKLNKTSPLASEYYSKKDNNQVAVEYKQPIQPYIYQNRPQEQVNYLTPRGVQQSPGQGMYPTPELLRGLQMVPYTRGTVQYPGGYQEKGYELVDKVYKEGGSPKLINVMDGYMPRKAVDNIATPFTSNPSGLSQNQLYALTTKGFDEVKYRKQAENVVDKGKGKFTLPTGETKDYSKMNFREKSYVKGEALKNRGRAFPDENNIIDDLNPLNWIGSMAGNMSQAPYVAQQTDSYIPYVTAIAEPLIMGRAIGSGSINPFGKKMWTNSISDAEFANSLLMGVPKASVKALSKLPFENVPILNEASRINPWRFKTQEGKIYRQVGKPGFEDALKEGKVYDKGQKQFLEENPNYNYLEGYDEAINAKGIYLKKPPPAPFFSKDKLFFPIDRKATGKGFKKTANSDAQYLIEGSVPDEGLFPRYMDRYLKPGELSSNTFVLKPEYNNLENFNLYERNWLEGYSKIKTPNFSADNLNAIKDLNIAKGIINTKGQPFPVGVVKKSKPLSDDMIPTLSDVKPNLKTYHRVLPNDVLESIPESSLDWGKWNKEIPGNKKLMQEYAEIEADAKFYGTWMKNPDGSPFQGTPEQFVQQNSKNFKKAFGNSKLINSDGSPTIYYHGSPKKFDIFDESKFATGNDEGFYGKGIYTSPNKYVAKSYSYENMFDPNSKQGEIYELYVNSKNPGYVYKNNESVMPRGMAKDFNRGINDDIDKFNYDLLDIKKPGNHHEVVVPFKSNPKSAIGNNGMFDMTNPNIYKTLIPAGATGLGLKAISQSKKETPEYQKGGFVDPEIIEARKKAYRTIKPSSYDDLNNIARWYSNTAREDYDEPRSEDAWAFYLKQKEKSDYLTPSKYKPSISKDPAAKYYNVDPELEQAIFNSFKDKVSLNKIMPVDEFDLNVRYTEEELEGIPHTNVGLKDRNATGSKARMLGRFSVSKGHDEKGDYLSYYDTYDFPEIIQNRVKGEPFNIYGRVYYPNNKKQFGGPIVDPRGQWKYPGQVTRIPSSNITMQGVDYPVYGVDNNGQEQMMYPGQEYNFPGADYVDEYPMMQKGGSIPVMKDGGLLSKSVTCSNCGWSWKGVEGGLDALTCHKCGGMIKMKSGGQHGGLDRWFAEKWVDVKTGKECGRQEGENRKGYPACRPSKRINADTPKTASELSSAEKAKFKQEKTSSERINYNHKKQMGGDIPYDTMENFYEMKKGGNVPTNPSLWSRAKSVAKSKYDVYPSAYANGFAAKWYKERGGGWRKAAYGMEVMENGGTNNPGFQALPEVVQAKILSNMGYGGYYNPMMANGGEPDGEMALGQIDAAINKLSKLRQFIQPDSDLEPWVSSKLTMVDDYANSVSDYIMYNPETEEMMELPLEEMKNGGIPERYKNMGFTKVGAKKQSTRPGKKWMVLAKKGDDYKVVHGGYKGMQDFKQHHSEQRRKNFWNRMGGKNSSKATDPFSPLYWHKRFGTWENGGQINQMQNGGIMMRDLQYPVYGIDRDLFNSRLQNGGNVNWLDNIN